MRTRRAGIVIIAVIAVVVCLGAQAGLSTLRRAHGFHPKTGAPLLTPGQDGQATLLFNGWRISPAGRSISAGDMLLGGAISPDGKLYAITNCGFGPHAVRIVDIGSEKQIAELDLGRAWNGMAWAPDGKRLYIAGGISNPTSDVYVLERSDQGTWERSSGIRLTGNARNLTCIAGLALTADGNTLFVLNNSDGCLYVVDTSRGATRARLDVGDHPIACRLSTDGKSLFVANIGGSDVALVDTANPLHPTVRARLATGSHPNELAISGDGRLFVSCGNSDAVCVYDAVSLKPMETIRTRMTPKSPFGSTPVSVAISPDNRTLYVANADNNDVCVVDISGRGRSRVRGFIPTGWYTSAVATSPDGKKLIVCSGKGRGSHPNPAVLVGREAPGGFEYIAHQLNGLVSFIDVPSPHQLADYTRRVIANTPYKDAQLASVGAGVKTAVPSRVGAPSPIKYILYIIKENRTYDEVYGDMPQGNGDPNLCLFGRDITPNQHALADQFVLLDNLYCNGEVSADGHPWSTSAYVTDFGQRSWVLSYSGHGATQYSSRVADPEAGYIWDACKRKGLTYRSYGEYVHATSAANAPEQKVEGATGLAGHGSAKYVGVGRPRGKDFRDPDKADIFLEELHDFERTNSIPRFMVMSLGENHTHGTTPGAFTPKACVASNDLAVGKIVDGITHSPEWKQFAIFIIEDDAQNGPDHVDSHRTAGLVISPYTRRRCVDSTMYSTTSMLRTMELILGLPPLTQYDAAATPMFASFTEKADLTPFTATRETVDLQDRNSRAAYGAKTSAQMDWSDYDRIDEDKLNRILWHSIKGVCVPMPSPVRSARL